MKKFLRTKYLSSLITLLLFLYACGTTKLMVPVTRPAEINLNKFKTIAIGEIRGKGGEDLAEDLTAKIFRSGRFEVLDRQHLNKLLSEHNLSFSGLVNPETSAELGQLLGTSALIFGRVSKYEYTEDITKENWESKDKKGRVSRHTTYTRIGRIEMDASLQITDLTTGKIVAIKNIQKSNGEKKSADDQYPPAIDKNKWLRWGYQAVANEFMKMIAPYKEMVSVNLLKDGDMPELEKGINFAKIGQWDKAIDYFEKAIKNYKTNLEVEIHKAYFNLGVACEYNYQFDKAEEALNKAYELKADEDYARELSNVKRMRKNHEKLQKQMKSI